MSKFTTRRLATCGMVAALYTIVYFVLSFLRVGLLEIRIAEALNILAVISPTMGIGVTLGCALSNVIGVATGQNPFVLDIFFGTFATGLAAYASYKVRHIRFRGYPILSVLPPILFNGFIIGGEITFLIMGNPLNYPNIWLLQGTLVAVAQILPCGVLGPLILHVLEKQPILYNQLTL